MSSSKIPHADRETGCSLLNCAIANDIHQPSRSFQLFLFENKCGLFFRCVVECPGDLRKDDIADDLD